MTAQQEMMKQLVSALGEVERGKQAGLANFINEYASRIAGRPSKEDHARVKAEVRGTATAGCPRTYSPQSVFDELVCTVGCLPVLHCGRHG